jgi:hypothetical protein
MVASRMQTPLDFHLDEVGELLVSIAALGLAASLWSASRRQSRQPAPLSVPR